MCVILICNKSKPSAEIIRKAEVANPDGAGIAWIEGKEVCWKKGLTGDEIIKEADNVPLPFALHFRLSTVGGKSPSLCHPFSIERNPSLSLEGKITKGRVLMHNGHWHKWKEVCMETVVRKQLKFPVSQWSDTRAIAWLVYHYGIGFLSLIDEKICIISPSGIKTFGNGWESYNNLIVSNTFFVKDYTTFGYGVRYGNFNF